ncbi:hypothetical protein HNR06_000390 [Nocardiopsis arvandica]|uniref:Uncharacterized protein n=1 Tax=Nocardiopsis sinuspersici TaxID=501010 RepID=A0A7Y9X7V0_9ACTN|nr:hypothetical protein [Nocardiopsis sinuspersici]
MRVVRWVAAVLAAALALVLTAAPAATSPRGGELDGFTIGHLPDQIDDRTSVSDFEYEWGDVSFSSRVWERTVEGGGARVVLQVLVMRGAGLTDLAAVRDFLAEYHERAPDWELTEFDNNGRTALHGETEAFWTPAEGVAVEVRDAFGLVGQEELLATARGVGAENPG